MSDPISIRSPRAQERQGDLSGKENVSRTISELLSMAYEPSGNALGSDVDQLACRIFSARQARYDYFEAGAFGETAWDMLLLLYCAQWRGRSLTAATLIGMANSHSAGSHWLTYLEQQGLVRRGSTQDEPDVIHLTGAARSRMKAFLKHISVPPGSEI